MDLLVREVIINQMRKLYLNSTFTETCETEVCREHDMLFGTY